MSRRLSEAKGGTVERVEALEAALRTTIEKSGAFFANADTKLLFQGKKNGEQDAEIARLWLKNAQLIKEVAFLQRQALEVRTYLGRNAFYRLLRPFSLSVGDQPPEAGAGGER